MEDEKELLMEMGVEEFVRRFKNNMDENEDSKFVFFLGAGCSVSSGIPDAGTLVRIWLPKLKGFKTGDEKDFDDWARIQYPGYDGANASSFYGTIIEDLFLRPEERQREIERLTERKDPSFGYAVLAQLMTHDKYGRHCNAVLTVNFDDLVADALYLYTHKKPLIISHESLVGFVRTTRTRPLVIKLHGDARLEPKNTEKETNELSDEVKKVLKNFLSEMSLIFIGYGGHDTSIAHILNELSPSALPWGIYWIGESLPEGEIGLWLQDGNATWVKHRDFDELMLLILNEFSLSHPDGNRFTKLNDTYYNTLNKLQTKLEGKTEQEIKGLSEALKKALSEATSDWGIFFEARKYEKTDPEKADILYEEGFKKFSQSAILAGTYALFLDQIRMDYNKAEEYYKKALDIEPENAASLNNYASFLKNARKDYDRAEGYYKKALDIEPENATFLNNYASFLKNARKDYDTAEEYFKEALDIEPGSANKLVNYANFLDKVRKDYDKAEEYYKKALDIEPENPCALSNYAKFLIVKGDEKGLNLLQKAMEFFKRGSCGTYVSIEVPLLTCLFHVYAHTKSSESRNEALNKMRKFLQDGTRAPGIDVSDNLKRAIEDGHPHPEFLTQLSKVISDEVDIKELDKFEEWKENN